MDSPLEIIGKTYGDMEVVDYVGCTDNYVKLYKVKCKSVDMKNYTIFQTKQTRSMLS